MKKYSIFSFFVLVLFMIVVRFCYFTNDSKNGYNATTYDALGYYMYSPAIYIHHDVKKLSWFPEMDSTYNMSGGLFYQGMQLENGDFTFKYLGGVSIMQLPFFAIGHVIASFSEAPSDGFSWPYQYSIMWGAIFWCALGLWFLRKVLLKYYSETITAITLLFIGLCTNWIQYVSIDGAQSHAHIFPLYCFVLYWTMKWHETPRWKYALFIGLTIGLATISRPTELIMFFIPLLWSLEKSGSLKTKWQLFKQNKSHLYLALLGGFLGMLPQFIYWKYTTGSWVYDVGSKWTFANPWWRVLIGFEKGWFIYTPITVFMVLGLFFMKGKPFRKAVLTFCLLNIWIVISWFDWRYGGTYSSRAMVQSYPVFALGFAALLERIFVRKWKIAVLVVGAWLGFVNLFQIWQYNRTILHYDHMNARYYKAIFLDSNPTPLDYSLLDTDELMPKNRPAVMVAQRKEKELILGPGTYPVFTSNKIFYHWLVTEIEFEAEYGVTEGTIHVASFKEGKLQKGKFFRLAVPESANGRKMIYINHFSLEKECDSCIVSMDTWNNVKFKNFKSTVTGHN